MFFKVSMVKRKSEVFQKNINQKVAVLKIAHLKGVPICSLCGVVVCGGWPLLKLHAAERPRLFHYAAPNNPRQSLR